LDWVILRPGFVVAPNAYGGSALVRGLAGFPLCVPLPAASVVLQTIAVQDVAETVRLSLADAPSRVVWELVHPDRLTLKDVVLTVRAWLGFAPARVIRVPLLFARLVSGAADMAGLFGWRSPLRTTALKQLLAGAEGNPSAWIEATGIRPKSLAETLAEHPAGVQERWFARAYFAKPLGLVLLAATLAVLALMKGR
jgi:nucleoside-diphosphate-sugar epimerase